MSRRIAIGQAGGPTAVINDTLAGIVYEAQKHDIEILGLRNGLEGGGQYPDITGNVVDLTNIDPYLLRGIPGSYLGTTRMKLSSKKEKDIDKIRKIEQNMKDHGIDMIFYIGGNDSAETLNVMERGIHVVKTEDNDLPFNDHTPGWGSACLANSEIIRALTPDVCGFSPKVKSKEREIYSTAPVVVYQAQGRNTGWLTLGTGFAKINHAGDLINDYSPHLFLSREIPFDRERFLDKVDDNLRKRGFVFICCSEELINSEGKTLAELYDIEENKDSFGHTEHARSGAFSYANFIASLVKENIKTDPEIVNYLKIKESPFVPNHIQRSLFRSKKDAEEAFDIGREAIRSYNDGITKCSIALQRFCEGYDIRPTRVSLESVAGKVRQVPIEYLGTIEGPSQRFYKDFLPLVDGPLGMTQYVGPRLVPFKN